MMIKEREKPFLHLSSYLVISWKRVETLSSSPFSLFFPQTEQQDKIIQEKEWWASKITKNHTTKLPKGKKNNNDSLLKMSLKQNLKEKEEEKYIKRRENEIVLKKILIGNSTIYIKVTKIIMKW